MSEADRASTWIEMAKLINDNKIEDGANIEADMAEYLASKGTDLGQAIQQYAILKKMFVRGTTFSMLNKSVNAYNNEIDKRLENSKKVLRRKDDAKRKIVWDKEQQDYFKKKCNDIDDFRKMMNELDEETKKQFEPLLKQALVNEFTPSTSNKKSIEIQKNIIKKKLDQAQVDTTRLIEDMEDLIYNEAFKDTYQNITKKGSDYQSLSLLSGPKTMLNNIIQNAQLGTAEDFTSAVATMVTNEIIGKKEGVKKLSKAERRQISNNEKNTSMAEAILGVMVDINIKTH